MYFGSRIVSSLEHMNTWMISFSKKRIIVTLLSQCFFFPSFEYRATFLKLSIISPDSYNILLAAHHQMKSLGSLTHCNTRHIHSTLMERWSFSNTTIRLGLWNGCLRVNISCELDKYVPPDGFHPRQPPTVIQSEPDSFMSSPLPQALIMCQSTGLVLRIA